MRLVFLLFALVAAATAVPRLKVQAGNVDVLTKQRHMVLLLDNILEDVDEELLKLGRKYDLLANIHNYDDQGVVKYLVYIFKLGEIHRRGFPYVGSMTKSRMHQVALIKTLAGAKDYMTFLKTAVWARCYLDKSHFVKAFVTALFLRTDTRDIVVLLPAYEIMPFFYFDSEVIREAQIRRAKTWGKTGVNDVIKIPVDYTSWWSKGENLLTYFTHDIGLNNYFGLFELGQYMLPQMTRGVDDTTTTTSIYDCDRCETDRGSQFYYVHQQLLARYNLERLSNNLSPMKTLDFTMVNQPFRPHMTGIYGGVIKERDFLLNLGLRSKKLLKDLWIMEERIKEGIDSGYLKTMQGGLWPLYNHKGLNILGTMMEGCGKSINPRYYGAFSHVGRHILGGSSHTEDFHGWTPSTLEMNGVALRDPVFYRLSKYIIDMFNRYIKSLPMYKSDDLILPGVKIVDMKFSKLETFMEKFKVDIDSATILGVEKDKKSVDVVAEVDRLNHRPYDYEIIVDSDKLIKRATVRVFIGPKFDTYGKLIKFEENGDLFFQLDQFLADIKVGQTILKRNSFDAPMRSVDFRTKKDILRGLEAAFNSHSPFYADKIPQMTGFPERLALPKGKCGGLPVQMFAIISDSKQKDMSFGPVLSMEYESFVNVNFEKFVGDYTKEIYFKKQMGVEKTRDNFYNIYSGERVYGRDSGERVGFDTVGVKKSGRLERSLRGQSREVESSEEVDRTMTVDTDIRKMYTTQDVGTKFNYLDDYYKNKHIYEIFGGFISLDGRPLSYPFDRLWSKECTWIPNTMVKTVDIFYTGKECNF